MQQKNEQKVKKSQLSLAEEICRLQHEVRSIREELAATGGSLLPEQQVSEAAGIRAVAEMQRTVYMPAGNDRHDRLMLELVDHDRPVEEVSLFCRPTLQSHPVALLRKMDVSENKIRKTQLSLEAYKSGRLKYTEILSKRKLWALLTYCPERKFCSYHCPEVTAADVMQHLDHLLALVETKNSYRLILSEVQVPLSFGTFEIEQENGTECWTVMITDLPQAERFKPSSVVIRDGIFQSSLKESVFEMVQGDSSAILDQREAAGEIVKIMQFLRERGPFVVGKRSVSPAVEHDSSHLMS